MTQTRREPTARLAWISGDTLWRSLCHGLGRKDKIDKYYLTCNAHVPLITETERERVIPVIFFWKKNYQGLLGMAFDSFYILALTL